MSKSKARNLVEFLRNINSNAKLKTDAVEDGKVITSAADLTSKSNDTTSLVSAASVTSYVGDKLEDYVHSTHDINLTFTGDVTGHGTITDMSHTTFNLTLDAETLPAQTGYAGKFLTTDGTSASWATVDTSNGDTAFSWGDHSTEGYATETYVDTELSNLVDSSPATLDTLNELAAALGDDPNFAATVSTNIGTKWTQDNTKIGNWDTAYSWGNHAAQSYLTTSTGVQQLGSTASPNYQTPSSRRVDPNGSNPTNAHHAISTFGNNGNVTGQLATHFVSGEAYTRAYNSSWSGWRKQWDASNDGSGSGLDADLLDGNHASAFALSHGHPYLSNATDSEQTGHFGLVYWNQNSARVNSDPRINESGYDADSTNIHWWTTTAAGANYGRVGHALYNGSAYQYLHTKASQGHLYHNNNKIWTSGNDGAGSGLDADLLDGQQPSALSVSHASTANYLPTKYNGGQKTNPQTYFNYGIGLRVAMTGVPSVWADTLWINGYAGADVPNMCALHTLRNGTPRMYISTQSNRATSYGSYHQFWTTYSDGSGSGLDADTVDGIQGSSLLRSDADDNLTSAIVVPTGNRNQGIFGTYDSYKTQHIWSMGTAYRNAANGSSFGNLYGAAYTYSNRVYTAKGKMGDGHQMVWCQNGTPTAAMGNHLWTSGNTYAAGFIYNSDAAFKENIEPLENSLDTILKLEGVKYTLKESGKSSIGFIAQDVEKVIPEFVEGDEGFKGVNYGQMVAVLTEAMKEQQKQIQELRAEIEELKGESK